MSLVLVLDGRAKSRQSMTGLVREAGHRVQVMASAVLRLGMLARELPEPAHQDSVHRVTLAIEAAIGRLRRLVFELNPPSLAAASLCEALRGYMVEYARESPVGWTVSDRLSEQPSDESKQILFRVAQEVLHNVRKHAGAQRIEILLAPVDGGTLLQVKDDGLDEPRSLELGGWLAR